LAGYEHTTREVVALWVDKALKSGTKFTCFHHHLIYMLEDVLPKSGRSTHNFPSQQ
jgi:tRNA-dihydrouridine synthase 4